MTNNIVDVKIWDTNVGVLVWDKDKDIAIFEYEPSFIKSSLEIAPLVMPLRTAEGQRYIFPENRNKCFKGLPGLIADSLPDAYGNQIIEDWFISKGIPGLEITPLDRLCYVGKRAMGALEYSPAAFDAELEASSVIEINILTELAKKILNEREAFQVSLKNADKKIIDILKVGTSAGGAKPKAIIAYNPKTKEVRSGQVKAPEGFGYYLLKFDGVENTKLSDNPMGIGNVEYAYYKMASDCGINMSESSLLSEGDYSHFMTKRFDRTDGGDKIHMQTLSAIAHMDRDIPQSYERAFQILRMLRLPAADISELFRRMVFNVVARNHDDHAKNHSFLMDKNGKWSLAPAYDLSFAYSEGGRWIGQHQMSVNGKRDKFDYNDLLIVGKRQNIPHPETIIDKTIEVVSQWRKYAKNAGVRPEHMNSIEKTHLLLSKPIVSQSKREGLKM